MTRPIDRSGPEQRLRLIVLADIALSTVAGSFTVVMSLTVARLPALFWVGLFVVATGGLIATSLAPLGRGDLHGAVLRLSIANWIVAIGSTAVATFQWPIQLQVAILPIVLAATFVSRRQLTKFVVLSLIAAALVAGLGLLQDVTGLSDEVPDPLKTAVLILTAPPFAALVVLVTVQHNQRLESVLQDEQEARRELSERADELRRSRSRVVAATDRERRRIERDLHDGAQSRLVAINLRLAAARHGLDDPDRVSTLLDDVRHEVHLAHDELRSLAHGLYPTVLTQHGLVPAIEAVADRTPAPMRLDLAPIGRLPAEVEAAVYFSIVEAVNNAAKHARAERVEISLRRDDDAVSFTVRDDGVGFVPGSGTGHGLVNIEDRIGAIGGSVEFDTAPGSGTRVRATVPIGSSSDSSGA